MRHLFTTLLLLSVVLLTGCTEDSASDYRSQNAATTSYQRTGGSNYQKNTVSANGYSSDDNDSTGGYGSSAAGYTSG